MSQTDSVQNSLLRLPLETVWLLPSLGVLVFLSYGIVPSVSDADGHGVTPLISTAVWHSMACQRLQLAGQGAGCREETRGGREEPGFSDCLRSGCLVREIEAMTSTL